jgi:hypothetical protein
MLSDELVLLIWKPRASAVVFDTAGTVVLGVATKDAGVYRIVFFVSQLITMVCCSSSFSPPIYINFLDRLASASSEKY